MTDVSIPAPAGFSSDDERFRLWQQRGREDDVRYRRRARPFVAAVVIIVLGGLWFLTH